MNLSDLAQYSKSHIEKRLCAAMAKSGFMRSCCISEVYALPPTSFVKAIRQEYPDYSIVVVPQCRFGPDELMLLAGVDVKKNEYAFQQSNTYILDFMIAAFLGNNHQAFCVECDGHVFHNASKEQALHDRLRDRRLLMHGIPTVRFTGSEINADADLCVTEIERVCDEMFSPLMHIDAVRGKPCSRR